MPDAALDLSCVAQSIGLTSTPSDGAAAWIARIGPIPGPRRDPE